MLDAWGGGARPPFSFDIGGAPAALRLRRVRRSGAGRERCAEHVYDVPGRPLTLTLRTTHVPDADLLTYQLTMRADASLVHAVSDVRVVDWELPEDDAGPWHLRGLNGGCVLFGRSRRTPDYPPREFAIWDRDLDEPFDAQEVVDGRCSREYLPIWFLCRGDGGVWFGPEWSGTWRLHVGREASGVVARLALPFTNFVLRQGEEVVFPPVTLGTWQGDAWEGCLALRRTIRDELMPRMDGRVPEPPVVTQVLGGPARELDADGLAREIRIAEDIGMECYIFASSWLREVEGWTHFPEHVEWALQNPDDPGSPWMNWWEVNGRFRPAASRFPDGLDAFAADLARRGMMLGLWYDPRVNVLVDEYEECADALVPFKRLKLRDKSWDMGLIDLGRESGRRYMLSLIERFVEEYGASWIWHDLNVETRMRYWDNVEEPDRRGLMELRYNEGMHRVYEEVLRRWPHVWIEWCASGGTMIDLGTLRRSHTLWIADYSDMGPDGTTDRSRAYRSCLNWILPATYVLNTLYSRRTAGQEGSSELAAPDGRDVCMHHLLTQFGSPFGLGHSLINWSEADLADVRKAVAVFKDVRHYLVKDFWGLFKPPAPQDGWDGWQYHDPADGSGLLVLFKGGRCRQDEETVEPRWVDPAGLRFETLLGEADIRPSGGALRVAMPGMAALVRYTRDDSAGSQGGPTT